MGTIELLGRLKPGQRRGSKPRCHWLAHGSADQVATRLSALTDGLVAVKATDRWMPEGFDQPAESQLHDSPRLLDNETRQKLRDWWLAVQSGSPSLPNWDIASTCTIAGRPGFLLVEGKAHDEELRKEEGCKRLRQPVSVGTERNHARIGQCMTEASSVLTATTGLTWSLSVDHRYQMSNRFAWSCKLTELGFPVALVYLGFLKAVEMADQGKPFETAGEWEGLVKLHSEPLFPEQVWGGRWTVHGQPLLPFIAAIEQPLLPTGETDANA